MRTATHAPALVLVTLVRGTLVLATLLVLVLTEAVAQAQTYVAGEETCDLVSDHPCGLQIQALEIEDVPAILKFQARVSQARLPVGDGTFSEVVVKLQRGGQEICREVFPGVTVRDSVLNLEIGPNMTCDLAEAIAESANLQLRICLGGEASCLDPVDLGATPYAIKATYARLAQEAHHANVAAQAHYAHRATADRDLFLRKTLGTGYFDFYTHPADDAQAVYPTDRDAAREFADGGFLQWTPVRGRAVSEESYTLHVAAKAHDTDQLRSLHRLVLDSAVTEARGTLLVAGTATAGAYGLTVSEGGFDVTGDSLLSGTLVVGAGVSAAPLAEYPGIQVTGDSLVDGALTVADATTLQAGLDVSGNSELSWLTLKSGAGLQFRVDESTTDIALFRNAPNDRLVLNPQNQFSGGTRVIGSFSVGGPTTVEGALTASAGATVSGGMTVSGEVTFSDLVTFEGGSVDDAQLAAMDARFVNVAGDTLTGLLTANGGLTVTGTTSLQGLSAGATTLGGLTVTGASSLQGLTAGATTLGSLDVAGDVLARGDIEVRGELVRQDGSSAVVRWLWSNSGRDPLAAGEVDDHTVPGVPLAAWMWCPDAGYIETNRYNRSTFSWEFACENGTTHNRWTPDAYYILYLPLNGYQFERWAANPSSHSFAWGF